MHPTVRRGPRRLAKDGRRLNCDIMNRARALASNRTPWLVPAVAAIFFTASSMMMAQQVVHLAITQPGGMPGLPVMTGIKHVTNGANVTWDGPSGYYQVYQKRHR